MYSNLSTASRAPAFRRAYLMGTVCLSALIGSTFITPAHAQETSKKEPAETQAETTLEPIVVLSTRGGKRILDVPQTVSVIGREELEDRNVRDIQDLVRHEPGVSVNRQTSITNPWGQLGGFQIRGMTGNRVQLSVDGSRVQESITDGSRDFFDFGNFKSVEIVRGPNSVLWGADALGGAVMFQTLDPSDLLKRDPSKPWALELKTGFDSFDGTWRKQIMGAYDFGDVEIMGSYSQASSHEAKLRNARADGGIWGCTRLYNGCNELFPADTDVDNALLKAVWTPTGDHTIKLTGELFGRDTSILQLYDMSAAANGVATTSAYNNENYVRDLEMSRKRIALEHEWDVATDWLDNVKWRVSYSPQSRTTDSNRRKIYSDRYEQVNEYRDYREDFFEADIQLQSSFDLGNTSHTLIYGIDGDRTKGDYAGIDTTYRSQTNATTVLTNRGFSFPRVVTERADIYLQDEIKLLDDRLTVSPGVRLAHYSIDPSGDSSYPGLPGYTPTKQSQTELLKRIGATYKLDDTYSVYASYGEGFKMPTSAQLFQSSLDAFGRSLIPNPDLRPESVESYEAGLRGEFTDGWFSFGGFYADYTDFIRSLQPTSIPGPGGTTITGYQSKNVQNVELWGIEFGGEYRALENTTLSANMSWSKGRQRVSATSPKTAFDGAVPFTAVLGVTQELPDYNLQLQAFATLAAGRTENAAATDFLASGYALFDTYAKWTPRKNFELSVGIENIFDRRYFPNTLSGYSATEASTAVWNVNPLELQTGAGRVFKASATVRF